jgi:hypothetical protein
MKPAMPPPRFRVVLTGPIRTRLDRWAVWADTQGLRALFDQAVATLEYRLQYEADEWGKEEELELWGPVASIRNGAELMFNVRYGIAFPQRLVFVTGLEWRDDYPAGSHPPDPPLDNLSTPDMLKVV